MVVDWATLGGRFIASLCVTLGDIQGNMYLCVHSPLCWLTPCALALGQPSLLQRGTESMNIRKFRLVLECATLFVEVARLALELLNMAFNYKSDRCHAHAR